MRNKIIHSLPWITIFWSLVMWFANDFNSWLRHSWKSLANHLTRDQKLVIHGNSCIILYINTKGLTSSKTTDHFQYLVCVVYNQKLNLVVGGRILCSLCYIMHVSLAVGSATDSINGVELEPRRPAGSLAYNYCCFISCEDTGYMYSWWGLLWVLGATAGTPFTDVVHQGWIHG